MYLFICMFIHVHTFCSCRAGCRQEWHTHIAPTHPPAPSPALPQPSPTCATDFEIANTILNLRKMLSTSCSTLTPTFHQPPLTCAVGMRLLSRYPANKRMGGMVEETFGQMPASMYIACAVLAGCRRVCILHVRFSPHAATNVTHEDFDSENACVLLATGKDDSHTRPHPSCHKADHTDFDIENPCVLLLKKKKRCLA